MESKSLSFRELSTNTEGILFVANNSSFRPFSTPISSWDFELKFPNHIGLCYATVYVA